jgi:NAD(P)-dependent dehydrogenase (short-subunit alcohol dehydrogenase family)
MKSSSTSNTGRRVVVTGAGRGIGRAIALAFARAGDDVAVVARTDTDLETLVADIEKLGRRCVSLTCDVTDPAQVTEMSSQVIEALGGVDILVNNAGNAESHPFRNHPDELWHRMLAANLTSVYYVTKAFAPALIEGGGGRIINIASVAARVGAKYVAAYTAAKHGVLGLTRALAVELMPHDITVNAICPGFVDTPMTQASISNIVDRTGMAESQAREALEKTSPQKRLIEPEEVAAVALFLAQESSKGINGQAINVDGGGVMS